MSFQDGVTVITAEWLNGVDSDLTDHDGRITVNAGDIDDLEGGSGPYVRNDESDTMIGTLTVTGSVLAGNFPFSGSAARYGNESDPNIVMGNSTNPTWTDVMAFHTNSLERIRITSGGRIEWGVNSCLTPTDAIYLGDDATGDYDGSVIIAERSDGKSGRIVFENTAVDAMAANIFKNASDDIIFRTGGDDTNNKFLISSTGLVKIDYKYTVTDLGDTSNDSQVCSTRYLKDMVDYTDRGSNSVSATSSYVLPAGIWTIVDTTSLFYLEIHNGTGWVQSANFFAGGTVISDGTNVRMYNSSAGSQSFRYLKQGLQR